MHLRPVRTAACLAGGLLLALSAAPRAQAQRRDQARPADQSRTSAPARSAEQPGTSAPRKAAPPARPGISSDQPSYRKEFTYGLNFNTRGGLIGGASVRSTHLLTQDWSRFWSIEVVEIKHPKEVKEPSANGSFVLGKSNYFYSVRPSVGLQRVVFRKAPDAGVQVNASLSGGPSIGLLMPYYISYLYSDPNSASAVDVREEQYDPAIHTQLDRIYDRAPLFKGIGDTKPIIGAHVRGALNFEFGRYRDAVTGVEVGALVEAYSKTPVIIRNRLTDDKSINDQFLPSVYLTVYLGSRN
ncbi:hypothetical protein [Hymenobacter actinosclerus]|uniref:Outer membrane protein beta-barrel domain-containing protein n=1 Tax=Hymenobacter actinosclerus TaxID=82805 RepID=A0A1I0I782_9BACT|nr:hypothetical protein [Hymenobacter actinosclerus]SET92370.1 hypothetical protein SAMN04487998_3180 [Hymenobacter actinosclerus]